MCFILEQEQPILLFSVYLDLDLNGTSVDLLALVKTGELAVYLEITGSKGCDIHEVLRLCSAELLSGLDISVVCTLYLLILELHVIDRGKEGGVTAVVRPVCIYHADLGNSGIALLRCEVIAAETKVVSVHSKTVLSDKGIKLLLGKCRESVKRCYGLGHFVLHNKSLGKLK